MARLVAYRQGRLRYGYGGVKSLWPGQPHAASRRGLTGIERRKPVRVLRMLLFCSGANLRWLAVGLSLRAVSPQMWAAGTRPKAIE